MKNPKPIDRGRGSVRTSLWITSAIVALHAPNVWGQAGVVRPPMTAPREEVLGYDAAQNVVGYIQRTPTALTGFSNVMLVTLARDGTEQRVRYTSDADIDQVRAAHDHGATQAQIDTRVVRDINAARPRFIPGSVFPVSLAGSGSTTCTRAAFAARSFTVGNVYTADVQPSSDGRSSTLTLHNGARIGAAVTLPSVTLTQGAAVVPMPYDTIADVRELPAGDALVVMLRSNACTIDGSAVPSRVVIVPTPPAPERALDPLAHAELNEGDAIRAVAPRARRRTVDEIDGFYDGRTHVIFNNAWALPDGGGDLMLVEYSRVEQGVTPLAAAQGTLVAHFAVVDRSGGHLRVRSELLPPPAENVYAGTGQEAFHADLDGDSHDEIIVRARYLPSGEVSAVLHVGLDATLTYVWRTITLSDDRTTGSSSDARRCDLGVDGRILVVRCRVLHYPPGNLTPTAPVISSDTLVQRMRWTGGTVEITQGSH